MKKIAPHDGLEVGRVSDDDQCGDQEEHGCWCNCGEECGDRVWRVGKSEKCAVCAARRGS